MRRPESWYTVVIAISLLLAWELVVIFFGIHEYLLPRPSRIAAYAFAHFGALTSQVAITFAEALLGFLVANLFAIGLAIATTFVFRLERAVLPLAIALKTTPIVAMAPLLFVWLGAGFAPKVAAAALISFFPALVSTIRGFHALQPGELDLMRTYGASKWTILLFLRAPRAVPYVFSALKISSSLAIVGAIVGEFAGSNSGIGYEILTSSYHLETARMFAALAFSALAGVGFYIILAIADKKLGFWVKDPLDEEAHQSPSNRDLLPSRF